MKLSKPQRQIYNMESLMNGSVSCVCGCMLLDTVKSEDEINNALNIMYKMNDALRIRIQKNGEEVSQYISDFTKHYIPALHFDSREELNEYADSYAKIPFAPDGPLSEITPVILPSYSGVLIKLHHIISDGWTCALVASQMKLLLTGYMPEAYSYTDYLITEEEYLGSKRYIKDKEYFTSKINECSEPLFISAKPDISFKAERKTFIIEETELLENFSRKLNTSVFAVVLAVTSFYFSRIKENADNFFIGTTVLNRTGKKERNTMGMYVNTVPVLMKPDYSATVSDNISAVSSDVLSVLKHQKFNYTDLLEESGKGKLFDVIVSYQNAQIVNGETIIEWYSNGMQAENLQIHIEDHDADGTLKMHFDYRTDKFTEDEIIALHKHIFNLIDDCITNPDKKIGELSMLSEDENHASFNKTEHVYDIPENTTIYSLFEKTARENTKKICIKTAEREMTFGELCCISENLDAEIRKITDGKKGVIGVIAERSVEMYSAVYGIIRGGNAYLPIDPTYPPDRIEYILGNSNATAVVCQGKFTHLAGKTPCIDITEFLNTTQKSENTLPSCADENDTAYVIYTSGSTGNPKGAKISHKSAVNRILWMHEKYPLGKDDVILQKTPYTFDVSVWELFWWGMVGGCLAASKPDEHFLPEKILFETEKNKVTHLHFVPSVFELFLNYLESHKENISKFESVKYVFLSGEALSASLVNRFYKLYDYEKVTLHNLYGPTECAVDVTYYDCKPDDSDPVPIGKPIYNTQMHIVDKYMNLVPIGVQGELCISGVNVGQGYLNNPELTEEKFIDNPFGEGKLYKTGDVAYRREDGELVFCGRKDSQIKLNGQRIEIGEIEAVISGVDGVDSVAVIVKKSSSKDMLVAFFTGENSSEEAVRSVCVNKLPKYMVPSAFMHLDRLPLNKNGKLDRRVLDEYKIEAAKTVDKEPPVNESEQYICDVFSNILSRNDIYRNTDFFEMGGTSLSMISLLSEKGFENITAADFMRNPSPAELAKFIQYKTKGKYEYLEELYIPENAKKSLVLLPFAGGGAEAYSGLVHCLKIAQSDTAVYFVPYLHSFIECEKAAREIVAVLNNKSIYIYSHCVGSALALKILKVLEEEGVVVKHYFAGASIPPIFAVKRNIWNIVPDNIIRTILIKAGADFGNIEDSRTKKLITDFRKDTDFANIVFSEFEGRLSTPLSVIISKKDIFTPNYRKLEKCWLKYFVKVEAINFLETTSHYFQVDKAQNLADIILQII